MYGEIVEQRIADTPGGLPAVWVTEDGSTTLFLRDDLPPDLVLKFRSMCRAASAAA